VAWLNKVRVSSRCEALSGEDSKAAFTFKSATAYPAYSFDKKVEKNLQKWGRISEMGLCLVHAVGDHALADSELFKGRAQNILSGWDVISTSLIRRRRPWAQVQIRNRNPKIAKLSNKPPGMYANVALILQVPPENILGTFPTDVFFPTHEPAKDYRFASAVLGNRRAARPVLGGAYTQIESPRRILEKTGKEIPGVKYNEILVVTRPHVRVHFSETKKVEVKGIIYTQGSCGFSPSDAEVLQRLCELNPNLPVEEA
jgi:hypothetical protein